MVIHCATGLKNSGDEAILLQLLRQYKATFDITVISLNKKYTEQLHSNITVISNSGKDCVKAIKMCDVFVLGGGGLLQDSTSIYNVFRWLSKLKSALKYHKKTYVYANSIGPLKHFFNRKLIKKYLSKVDYITLRDNRSFQLLQKLGVTSNITVTADPVFSLCVSEENEKHAVNQFQLHNAYVSIAVRHWFDMVPFLPVSLCTKYHIKTKNNRKKYDKYINELRNAVVFINEKLHLPVYFISFFHERDSNVAKDILNTKDLLDQNRIIDNEFITPEEIITIIKKSRFLIGMRLHSIIYAVNAGVPVIPIIYEEKIKGIIEIAKLEKYSIDIENMTSKYLIEKINILHDEIHLQKSTEYEVREYMKSKEKINQEIMMRLIKFETNK